MSSGYKCVQSYGYGAAVQAYTGRCCANVCSWVEHICSKHTGSTHAIDSRVLVSSPDPLGMKLVCATPDYYLLPKVTMATQSKLAAY